MARDGKFDTSAACIRYARDLRHIWAGLTRLFQGTALLGVGMCNRASTLSVGGVLFACEQRRDVSIAAIARSAQCPSAFFVFWSYMMRFVSSGCAAPGHGLVCWGRLALGPGPLSPCRAG